jgi:hypothetical protein
MDASSYAIRARSAKTADGVLFFLFFHVDDFAGLDVMPAAIPADRVRENGRAATVAVGVLPDFEMKVTSPLTLAGVRRASLGNSHGSIAFLQTKTGKLFIVRGCGESVKACNLGLAPLEIGYERRPTSSWAAKVVENVMAEETAKLPPDSSVAC